MSSGGWPSALRAADIDGTDAGSGLIVADVVGVAASQLAVEAKACHLAVFKRSFSSAKSDA